MVTEKEVATVFSILEKNHQPTMLELLGHYTHFQMLVMTLLSSRTKDSTTIPIVKKLFQRYPTPQDFMTADRTALEKAIYGIGFYRVKAVHLQQLSKILIEKYHGNVPHDFQSLTSLPGVGRKTANCMLNYAFHLPAIAVDIHVHRIANRLGWITTATPEESEKALETVVPKPLWIKVNQLFVGHGQTICMPINPKCEICPINLYCAYGRNKLSLKSNK
ncbi:MAG: endonuclease III [Nanoarchaeota archaeon]|nr:endonuclease III [Nanoarchaeota archaeon]